jgi:hypothetical protein
MSRFKYETHLSTFNNCPPADYQELDITAYRWIFEDVNDERNFQPVLIAKPSRAYNRTDMEKCKGCGLPLFNQLEGAVDRYKELLNDNPKIVKTIGTKVATVKIEKTNGCGGNTDKINGHFTFHEYAGSDLKTKIENIQDIF